MSTHTKGPWVFEEGRPSITKEWYGAKCVIAQVKSMSLDWHEDKNKASEEAEANAHLIAAAPDMLEALESILPEIECNCPSDYLDRGLHESNSLCHHIEGVKAAIAKAKGESL